MNKHFTLVTLLTLVGGFAAAQSPLTLQQAQAAALKQQPGLRAALATAEAANQVPGQVRSAYLPQIGGNLTAVGAERNSRIAAGGLNNPVIFSRYANGFSLSQQITNFGRTASLVQSARRKAQAQQQEFAATRAQVLLQVDQAYFRAQQAQAVEMVARQAVADRQVMAKQVSVLARNKLRSTLDVSFAQVNLAQAQLLLSEAENEVRSGFADLALAMGTAFVQPPQLEAQPLPASAPALDDAIASALQNRPELAAAGLQFDAARAFAQAQRDLNRPTFSAVAAAGLTPYRAAALPSRYAAAGVNLSIPIFNGGLFGAERREAEFQATASQQRLAELRNQIEHDVQVAWLNVQTAQQQLGLTEKLQQQATLAIQLAQARYRLGLGSIVELSQAQLNQTQADVAAAQARYQLLLAAARLAFQAGTLR